MSDKKNPLIKGYIRLNSIPMDAVVSKNDNEYLNIVLVPTPNSKKGSEYMAVVDTPKGEKGAVLGDFRLPKAKDDTTQPADAKEGYWNSRKAEGGDKTEFNFG